MGILDQVAKNNEYKRKAEAWDNLHRDININNMLKEQKRKEYLEARREIEQERKQRAMLIPQHDQGLAFSNIQQINRGY